MSVIYYKIWRDLWENKGRTLRVVAVITIGAFAVGATFGSSEFITQDVARTWLASNPATIGLTVKPAIDETMIESLAHLRELETVVGWMQQQVEWRPNPDVPWQPALLIAIDDYEAQSIRQIELDAGDWPAYKQMGVQRGHGLTVGDQFELRLDYHKIYPVELNGVLYNAATPPNFANPTPVFFTTRERFTELTGQTSYNLVLATIPAYTDARAEAAADVLQQELEKQDIEVEPALAKAGNFKTRTNPPNQYVAQDVMDGMALILHVLALATLVLGLFLVYNTINAIITQQMNQIGIMKAIGARLSQILLIYFWIVFIYAGLALLVAAPLGALGAHGLRVVMVNRFVMSPGRFAVSPQALLIQSLAALLSPLLAAALPIFAGVRVTVREAVTTYGLTQTSGRLDHLLARFQAVPRLAILTLSNTFRNTGRVAFTQITLVGAGVIFMMVMNVRTSLGYTFREVIFSISNLNVMLDLAEPARIKKVEALTLAQSGVKTVEVWATATGTARRQGQPESNEDSVISLRGTPLPAATYRPYLQAGRWLQQGDQDAVVLNREVAEEMGIGVGDWITVDIPNKRETDWQVVGLIFEPREQDAAFVSREMLNRLLCQVGQGQAIRVQTCQTDAAAEDQVAADLRMIYEAQGYNVVPSITGTAHRLTDTWVKRMEVLLLLLSGMALIIAIVGAVALSGTLSLNVLERTREIGVMRAIGASATAVAGQFIGEGLLLGWLSWLLAIPLSIPAGQLVINLLGGLINTHLVYRFSGPGVFYWLAIVSFLAVLASWFPAQKAAQMSVRESLAYQ